MPPPRRETPPDVIHTAPSDWKAAVRSVLQHVNNDRVNVAAGAFAYRWFLSLFPAVIALIAATSLLALPRAVTLKLAHGVSVALPAGASGVLNVAIKAAAERARGSLAALVVAGLVALWSATSGMVMLEEGLDMAYEVNKDRTFLSKRLVAVSLLAGAAVLGGAASALVVFGPQIGRAIKAASPVGGAEFSTGWTVLRWVVALVMVNVLLAYIYWLAPNARTSWRWFSPGSAVGTVLWAAVSLGFSLYTNNFGTFGKTYGAFAGVAVLIFWLYLTGAAVLLGGEVNAAFERQAAASAGGAGNPEEVRGPSSYPPARPGMPPGSGPRLELGGFGAAQG